MSDTTQLFDQRDWTYERLVELLDEPENENLDWRRFEILDGALVVSPQPSRRHESKVMRLGVALASAIPAGFELIAAAGIATGRSYHVTDVTVVARSTLDLADPALTGDGVMLAVEIESPSSMRIDRVLKPSLYAAAGVPYYWRVEAEPLRLVTYRLTDGVYAEAGSWGADETAWITDPFPAEFAVGSLLPPG